MGNSSGFVRLRYAVWQRIRPPWDDEVSRDQELARPTKEAIPRMTQTTTSWPAHDPATRRWLPESSKPLDPGKVASLLAAEWDRFTADTPESGDHNRRASKSLPLGVTSSFQHWDPYPISIASARGAWLHTS